MPAKVLAYTFVPKHQNSQLTMTHGVQDPGHCGETQRQTGKLILTNESEPFLKDLLNPTELPILVKNCPLGKPMIMSLFKPAFGP